MDAGHCGASLSKQYAKDYNCAVRIHACPIALLVEVSKLVWRFLNKLAEEVNECLAVASFPGTLEHLGTSLAQLLTRAVG